MVCYNYPCWPWHGGLIKCCFSTVFEQITLQNIFDLDPVNRVLVVCGPLKDFDTVRSCVDEVISVVRGRFQVTSTSHQFHTIGVGHPTSGISVETEAT